MSMAGQRARDLVAAYNNCLEKQIVDRGTSLPCQDENLCNEVEKLLKSEDGCDTHCLGLDTLKIIEDSLITAVAESKQAVKVRPGLKGIAKAFEVLEQAALNLYLGPWREEYKVVKMYSGLFTHFIKPVFSMQQIEQLFGLLGYKPCPTRREQLRLQPREVSAASLEELLHLACAFFVARSECRLLLATLGKQSGQPQWELTVVKERQRGNSLQVALDSTIRMMDVTLPIKELTEESDIDLYRDEHDSEGLRDMSADEPPCSLPWIPEKSANGVSKPQIYTSIYYSQLKKPPADSTANGSSSVPRYGNHFYEESFCDKVEAQPLSPYEEKPDQEVQNMQLCTCLEVKRLCLYKCTECQSYHHVCCPKLDTCKEKHNLEYVVDIPKEFIPMRAEASQRRGSISPLTSSSAALSSLVLNSPEPKISPSISPLDFHNCCNNAKQDPQVLCFTCNVFHIDYCPETKICLSCHGAKKLGMCTQDSCCMKTHMLCRYCGNEYCKDCWYKFPITCKCGQTFDFSSPV